MVSERLRKRLASVNAILDLLDLRRAQSGDGNLGSAMERRIVDAELADLERTMAAQENTERTAPQNPRPTRTDL